MAWYLMYLYNPGVPSARSRYKFFALKDVSEEYSQKAEDEAQVAAGFVWAGFQSGFAYSEKGKVSDAEVVWRMKLEVPANELDSAQLAMSMGFPPDAESALKFGEDLEKMAKDFEALTDDDEIVVDLPIDVLPPHNPDPTAEQ